MGTFTIPQLLGALGGFVAFPPYAHLDANTRVEPETGYSKLPVDVPAGGETGMLGVVIALPLKLDDLKFPNEPLISISSTKLIIKTVIDGNDGTFKENYSQGDYQISIRGMAVNEDDLDNYPEDIIRQMRRVLEQKKHIAISNALTTLFGITHVAIESYDFPAEEGMLGAQGYEIQCSSDKEFQLRLRER